MKVIVFAPGAAARAVAEALHEPLAAAGWKPELAPDGAYAGGAESAARETAAALLGSERLLDERRPQAALVIGGTNPALAAAIAASRIELPVASIGAASERVDGREGNRNRHLVGLIADLVVDGEDSPYAASEIEAWLSASRDAPAPPTTG